MERSPLDVLQEQWSLELPAVRAARADAVAQRARIAAVVGQHRLTPVDTCLVVFGSLARDEWTSASDIDWALLVDGPADPSHSKVVLTLGDHLQMLGRTPGPTGVFAGPAFSHPLVHWIGGEQDTNRNITQRVLLLLESRSIPGGDGVRERVVRAVLQRYVEDDQAFQLSFPRRPVVPWFLLNDVVRYWRTMAVDLVAKRRERSGRGWAVRTLKLRTSRKLIFVAGLLACLLCRLRPAAPVRDAASADDFSAALADHLFALTSATPLELLAQGLLAFQAEGAARSLLPAYDDFLRLLGDEDRRKVLEALSPAEAAQSVVYAEAREIGHRFQEGLDEFLLRSDPDLARDTLRFGVF